MTSRSVLPITISDSSKGKAKQNIKIWSMIILIVQNTALVLMMRASRTAGGDMYSATSCVFFMEVLKVIMSLIIIFYQKEFSTTAFFSAIHSAIMGSPTDTMKMMIPATIYAIQNNLLFIALSNLNATTYQVTYQLKILTTAICSVIMLGKQLQRNQWLALLLLMVGVCLVQLDIQAQKLPDPLADKDDSMEKDASMEKSAVTSGDPIKGLFAVILACFSSGFAGVYFEKVVKSAESNIWMRNIQLGIFGTLFSFLAMIIQDGGFIYEKGIFFGYNWLVVGVVFMQAAGGLLVAVVVKYADNILKGFATSLSIVLSAIMQVGFMHEASPSVQFVGGTVVVLFSVYLYSLPAKK